MTDGPLPFPTETKLLAASGYPYLPVRVRHRAPRSWHPLREGVEVARYTYTGENGEPRLECIRFHLPPEHPSAPDKTFLWRRMDVGGRWTWGAEGAETLLYRADRVRAAVQAGQRVFVVEGEKDVHALEALGLTATTNPNGTLQWTQAHADGLRGADVVVVPDLDRAGKVHAARVAASLRGRARSTALLLLPLAEGGDVSDWLAGGNGAGELERLADAAPRDLPDDALAALLHLPPGLDLLSTTRETVLALVARTPSEAGTPPHPAFRRSVSAFARLGVGVRPAVVAPRPEGPLPEAHPTYLAVTAAIRGADAGAAPLLEDASLLDRRSYELNLFGPLLRAAMAAEPPAPRADLPDRAFATAPSVRLVHTRWDWDAFLADAGLEAPGGPGAVWVLHLAPSGAVQARRLHPLPALLLEVCVVPRTRAAAAAAVARQVAGDPDRIAERVSAQMDELCASGLLQPFLAPTAADHTVREMERLLLDEAPPRSSAPTLVGQMARIVQATRRYAEDAVRAPDGAYSSHRVDIAVDMLEQLLARARLRNAFATELDSYWSGTEIAARVASLSPLLEVLGRVLDSGVHASPPCVLSS